MLLDDFLSVYQFNEVHKVTVHASVTVDSRHDETLRQGFDKLSPSAQCIACQVCGNTTLYILMEIYHVLC